MDKLNRNRSLTNAGSNPFHRPVPYVANGKNPWNIRLQQKGGAIQGPASRALSFSDQIRPGQNESSVVAFNRVAEPVGTRQRPYEDIHRRRRNALDLIGIGAEH